MGHVTDLLAFFFYLFLVFICIVLPYFLGYGTVGFQQLLDNGDLQVVNENRILTFYNERGYRF
jgi:hypothetical protein